MKVIMVMVSSLNGKITRGSDPNINKWTSGEDAKLFKRIVKSHNLIIMGSRTYEAVRDKIKIQKGKLRIVLTRNPGKYKRDEKEGIEFTRETPSQLLKRMESLGYKKALLVGGGTANTLFLERRLVDEIWLTVEPVIFGKGRPLVHEKELETMLFLAGIKKLNKRGTLHLKYTVKSKT